MPRFSLFTVVLLSVFAFAALTLRLPGVSASLDATEEVEDGVSGERGPIVVELFTSQGCSSCPPADRLLSTLGVEADDDVIALAFHVDYWDYIGWKDPFSSKDWSKRQEGYARSLKAGRLYTPQLVVDGREHCVGSRGSDVEGLLRKARRRGQDSSVEVVGEMAKDASSLHLAIAATSGESAKRPLDLIVAVVENGLETAVKRGENAKRSLHNDHVVRQLRRVGEIRTGQSAAGEHQITVDLESDWKRDQIGVVAFLQDPKTLAIYGAGQWRPGV